MSDKIRVGDLEAEVVFKNIRNVHLGVYPPDGHIRISAPESMQLENVRLFAVAKLGWIREQQKRLLGQRREAPREYVDRESHYIWGRRYMLQLVEIDGPPRISLAGTRLMLYMRPGTDPQDRAQVLDSWYRNEIREALPQLLGIWERRIGVAVERVFIQYMKTKWGSCNPERRHIRINTDLAKKPRECLEYIVVHELAHLLVPVHNDQFLALMDRHLPQWRDRRELLNALPIRHETWMY